MPLTNNSNVIVQDAIERMLDTRKYLILDILHSIQHDKHTDKQNETKEFYGEIKKIKYNNADVIIHSELTDALA